MRIGIDLLWVRPGICGGTESFVRNLLDGFVQFDQENDYILFVAQDNAESFRQYRRWENMSFQLCPVKSAVQYKRILWENLHLDRYAAAERTDVMLIPVYSKPHSNGKIPYVSVIHDLQAFHFPQYFSLVKRIFFRSMWQYTCKSSKIVITISDYCRADLSSHYPFAKEKMCTVYNPVITEKTSMTAEELRQKYRIEPGSYFYCVSSLLPHKNLGTILKVMEQLKKMGDPTKLVLSGVGGNDREFGRLAERFHVADRIIQTGFVTNTERDCLYENCRIFLFPSIFEGFGMPPVEAMRRGRRVVMTREACLQEITEGKAVYVDDPYDVKQWLEKIAYARSLPPHKEKFERYELENVVGQYLKVLRRAVG